MKFRYPAILLATAALTLSPHVASATTFTYFGDSVVGGEAVSISSPTVITANTGMIQLNGAGPNAGQTLDAWCVDLFDKLLFADTYNITPLTTAGSGGLNPALTSTQINEMGALMLVGEAANGPDAKAASQLAIWLVEYGGSFSSNANATLVNLADLDILSVQSGGSNFNPSVSVLLLTDAPTLPNQTLAIPVGNVNGPPETPIMGTIGLFASGLVVFAFLQHRRRKTGGLPTALPA